MPAAFTRDATGCVLTVTSSVSTATAHLLLEQSWHPSRKRSEMPLHERLLLDSQHDVLAGEDLPCSPSTYAALPADSIFSSPLFSLTRGVDRVLDIGAGDGLIGATAVLRYGAASAFGVELSEARVADGCAAMERLASALAALPREPPPTDSSSVIELRVGDARTASYGSLVPTRALMYATCYPRSLAVSLQQRLATELPIGARVLAAGVRGWETSLDAVHRGSGRRQLLVNEEVARRPERACCVAFYQADASEQAREQQAREAASAHEAPATCEQPEGERPCLGDDMTEWLWKVVEAA